MELVHVHVLQYSIISKKNKTMDWGFRASLAERKVKQEIGFGYH